MILHGRDRQEPAGLGALGDAGGIRLGEGMVVGKTSRRDDIGAEIGQCLKEFLRPADPGEGEHAATAQPRYRGRDDAGAEGREPRPAREVEHAIAGIAGADGDHAEAKGI